MGVNFVDFFFFLFFSLLYNEVVSVFNRHGPRQRRTTKTDSQHCGKNKKAAKYTMRYKTMAFGKGQTWPKKEWVKTGGSNVY